MNESSRRDPAPDRRGRSAPTKATALLRAFGVVVAHEAVEAEHHAPEFLENRALQPFDEAISPGVTGFRARWRRPSSQQATSNAAWNSAPPSVEHAPHRPAGALEVRHDDLAQERGGGPGGVGPQQAGQPIGGRRLACRDLPDLAHALEVADLEGVQAHEFARLGRLDVPRAAVASAPELLPSAFRQQPRRAGRLLLVAKPTRRSSRCTGLGARRTCQVRAR
jgi:hypothetical protein